MMRIQNIVKVILAACLAAPLAAQSAECGLTLDSAQSQDIELRTGDSMVICVAPGADIQSVQLADESAAWIWDVSASRIRMAGQMQWQVTVKPHAADKLVQFAVELENGKSYVIQAHSI